MREPIPFTRRIREELPLIAVFDSGIGSYSIVKSIKDAAPNQDILYFADRKSFPYGTKTPDELFHAVSQAIRFLETYRPSAIVIASNVPSVTIMPQLKATCATPLYGIFLPVAEAMEISRTKNIGVLGVQAMVTSPSIQNYIATQTDTPERVHAINASALVEKVESGAFLFDESATAEAVRGCIDKSLEQFPSIDTFTLSSTHLPWLAPYFRHLYPGHHFIDPAASMVKSLPLSDKGTGCVTGLATAGDSPSHSKENFDKMLAALGIDLEVEWVDVEQRLSEKAVRCRYP